MDVSGFLGQLTGSPSYEGQIVHIEVVPPKEAREGALAHPLDGRVVDALEKAGLWPLYSHQAEAVNHLYAGSHVMVSTPAASGKSLCYQIPVIESILADSPSRALFLHPTKALTQDQLKSMRNLTDGLPVKAAVFDGDTPYDERAAVRRSAHVILTNPDMLHLGILPNHRNWSRFFRGLKYVVLDEAHVYRGVFGSHLANLLRRLRRVCKLYGSSPQFILCSATIANPDELASDLTGLDFQIVEEDGAPSGGRRFAFWNPPFIENTTSSRRSANTEAATLFSRLIAKKVRTLTFVRTRRQAELVYLYAREQLESVEKGLGKTISPYRATYLPEDRRRIEADLLQGNLLGLASTNALELGIDVGSLDATVITGYPGSIASTWQQAGRSGRRGDEALSVLVGRANPLDQYLMNHPEFFFGKPVENALISPENPYIIGPHLLCAAYEAPLEEADSRMFGASFKAHVDNLVAQGFLRESRGKWHVTPDMPYPAELVNIRSDSQHAYPVVEEESGVILETVDETSAYFQLHPGAVYLHQGEAFRVADLDLENGAAYVSRTDSTYYTQSKDTTDITINRVRADKFAGGVQVYLGDVEVTTKVTGYQKRRPLTEEVLGEEWLDLPPRIFNTVALWFDIPDQFLEEVDGKKLDLAGSLHAAEHAMIGVLPLFALCDRNDIGGVSTPLHPDTKQPQIFIYDGHPGGIGIAEMGYQMVGQLWNATLGVVTQCPCDDGCPSCIQSPKCGNNNYPLDKDGSRRLLEMLSD